MFIPGEELLKELVDMKSGVRYIREGLTTEPAIIVKLPTPTLKAVYRGKPFILFLAIGKIDEKFLLFTGFIVDDGDPIHPLIVTNPLLDGELFQQTDSLKDILSKLETKVHFFDELNYPVVSANCKFNATSLNDPLFMLELAKSNPGELSLYDSAHDILQKEINLLLNSKQTETFAIFPVRLTFNFDEAINIFRLDTDLLGFISPATFSQLTYGYISEIRTMP